MAKTVDTISIQTVDEKLVMTVIYVATITDPFTGEQSVVRSAPVKFTDANAPEFKAVLGDLAVTANARANELETLLAAQVERAVSAETHLAQSADAIEDRDTQIATLTLEAEGHGAEVNDMQLRIDDAIRTHTEVVELLDQANAMLKSVQAGAETAAANHARATDEANTRYLNLQSLLTNEQRQTTQLRQDNATLRTESHSAVAALGLLQYQYDVLKAKFEGTPIPPAPPIADISAQVPAPDAVPQVAAE